MIRLRELRAAGAIVGLGTDGAAYNHRQDMFECMKQAVLVQRVHALDPTVCSSTKALELATREGARLVGVDAGVLAPGKLADVTVVDLGQPHLTPHHQIPATLVYAARGADVAMTIVGGKVVYEQGRCLLVDEPAILSEARSRAAELVQRADLVRP